VDYDPADYPKDHMRSITDLNFNLAGQLSGSMLTMDKAVRNFRKHTGASVVDLFQMASATPAKTVKVFNEVGSLTPGKYANMVIMNEALELQKVIFRGTDVE